MPAALAIQKTRFLAPNGDQKKITKLEVLELNGVGLVQRLPAVRLTERPSAVGKAALFGRQECIGVWVDTLTIARKHRPLIQVFEDLDDLVRSIESASPDNPRAIEGRGFCVRRMNNDADDLFPQHDPRADN